MIERRRADPAMAVLRSLRRAIADAEIEEVRSEPWASVTFSGVRLSVRLLTRDRAAADRLLLDLPELEWRTPGHLVADAAGMTSDASAGAVRMQVELLVLERD